MTYELIDKSIEKKEPSPKQVRLGMQSWRFLPCCVMELRFL